MTQLARLAICFTLQIFLITSFGCGGDVKAPTQPDNDVIPSSSVVTEEPEDPRDLPPELQLNPDNRAWSVLPPGNGNLQGRTAYAFSNQAKLYDRVDDEVADGDFYNDDFKDYFKDSRLGFYGELKLEQNLENTVLDRSEETDPIYGRTPGTVNIKWDEYAVPHITAEQSWDVAFGSGYATGMSRGLVAEIIRAAGRAGVVELGAGSSLLGDPLAILEMDAINYSEEELMGQFDRDRVCHLDPSWCDELLAIAESYVAGINQYYRDSNEVFDSLNQFGLWPSWRKSDLAASAITLGTMFGFGGGSEVANSYALRKLIDAFGEEKAKSIYNDLRMADTQAVTHTDTAYQYPVFDDGSAVTDQDRYIDPAAIAYIDDGLFGTLPPEDLTALTQQRELPSASNYLVVDGSRTYTGAPMLSGGPQTGYIAPEMLVEMELVGGGYNATGMTVPGLGVFILVGHTPNYGWTITAGGSDIADDAILKLCNPDGGNPAANARHYFYKGECRAMISTGGMYRTYHPDPLDPERMVSDPITHWDLTVNGEPVAVAFKRASRGREIEAAVSVRRLNFNEVLTAEEFPKAMDEVPYSMNWAYLNQESIAYIHTGIFPIRKAGVVPDLPVWETGEWDWTGVIETDWDTVDPQFSKAHVVAPSKGYLTSWNNRVAPGWTTADNGWGQGLYHRVVMLDDLLADQTNLTLAEVLEITQNAATTDLRGHMVVPRILVFLRDQPAPEPYLAELLTVLEDWTVNGSHRRDRDYDGIADHPAVGVMDNLVHTLTDVFLYGNLGELRNGLPIPGVSDKPGPIGSAFQNGQSGYVLKALDRVSEEPGDPNILQCGDGSRESCRAWLWQALTQAYWITIDGQADLEDPFDIWSWEKNVEGEYIQAAPGNLDRHQMRWQNRPTFHQVLSFKR